MFQATPLVIMVNSSDYMVLVEGHLPDKTFRGSDYQDKYKGLPADDVSRPYMALTLHAVF